MFFRRQKGQKDPEVVRIEEQLRIIEEARNCKWCDDYGVSVEVVKYAHDPDNLRTEYRQCDCGAPVHPKLAKYVEQKVAS